MAFCRISLHQGGVSPIWHPFLLNTIFASGALYVSAFLCALTTFCASGAFCTSATLCSLASLCTREALRVLTVTPVLVSVYILVSVGLLVSFRALPFPSGAASLFHYSSPLSDRRFSVIPALSVTCFFAR